MTLLRDRRGLSSAEYVVILAVVAVGLLLAWESFGTVLGDTVTESGVCLETRDGRCVARAEAPPVESEGVLPSGAALSRTQDPDRDGPGARPPEPSFAGIGMPGTYGRVRGKLVIRGTRDLRGVHANDVRQGQIADCAVIASIASVANSHPELIERAVRDNRDGTYTVTFHVKGDDSRWTTRAIRVTAELPQENGRPVFAATGDRRGRDAELWPAIVEKAYAQLRGGYEKIAWTSARSALEALTGRDGIEQVRGTDGAWAEGDPPFADMKRWLDAGYPVVASTLTEPNGVEVITSGKVVTKHAYFVVDIDETARTVTVRNPWGWGEGKIVLTYDEFQAAYRKVTHVEVPREPRRRRWPQVIR